MVRQKSQAHHFVHTHVSRLNEEMTVIANMLRKPKAVPSVVREDLSALSGAGCCGI